MSRSLSWESKPLPPRIGGALMVLIGLAFLVGSWLWHKRSMEFIASAAHTQGTIIEMERSNNSNSHFPVFTYKDARGQLYEIRSSYSSDRLRVGNTVAVSYDPAAPYDAVLSDLPSRPYAQLFLAGMGAAFILGGILMVWSHNWWVRAARGKGCDCDSEQTAAGDARNART